MAGSNVPKPVRIICLLIWLLSGKADLGMSYVLSRRTQYELDDVDLLSTESVALCVAGWLGDASVILAVHAALAALDNNHRTVADEFLMHSLLVEFIIRQNRKGVAVDLTTAIAKYIRLWTFRPMADKVKRRLAKLVWHRGTRRRFGVNLRREWALCFNNFAVSRDLSSGQIHAKVIQCRNLCRHA